MELVTVNPNPIEVSHSLRQKRTFPLTRCTIQQLNDKLNKAAAALQDKGLDLFILEFTVSDDDDLGIDCSVVGSRLETSEEVQKRVERHTSYNNRQIAEHKQKIEASKRRKELDRLTSHLTVEQLQAIRGIQNG